MKPDRTCHLHSKGVNGVDGLSKLEEMFAQQVKNLGGKIESVEAVIARIEYVNGTTKPMKGSAIMLEARTEFSNIESISFL